LCALFSHVRLFSHQSCTAKNETLHGGLPDFGSRVAELSNVKAAIAGLERGNFFKTWRFGKRRSLA
jgi:hypothetical protein